MVRCGVLTFGDFMTKSGRKTPFFINTGNYRTGAQIQRLGEFYAAAINRNFGKKFNVLYGPAYKGIPLVVTTAAALAAKYGHDVAFCFNRKEPKDHGEGGVFVGHTPGAGDRIVIVEDVVTSGISVRESMMLLTKTAAAGVHRAHGIGQPYGTGNQWDKRSHRACRGILNLRLCHRDY